MAAFHLDKDLYRKPSTVLKLVCAYAETLYYYILASFPHLEHSATLCNIQYSPRPDQMRALKLYLLEKVNKKIYICLSFSFPEATSLKFPIFQYLKGNKAKSK